MSQRRHRVIPLFFLDSLLSIHETARRLGLSTEETDLIFEYHATQPWSQSAESFGPLGRLYLMKSEAVSRLTLKVRQLRRKLWLNPVQAAVAGLLIIDGEQVDPDLQTKQLATKLAIALGIPDGKKLEKQIDLARERLAGRQLRAARRLRLSAIPKDLVNELGARFVTLQMTAGTVFLGADSGSSNPWRRLHSIPHFLKKRGIQ